MNIPVIHIVLAFSFLIAFSQKGCPQSKNTKHKTIGSPNENIRDLALYDQDYKLAYTSGKAIVLYSIAEERLLKRLEKHDSEVMQVEVSPDGKWLASGDRNGQVILWSLPEGEYYKSLPKNAEQTVSLDFSHDSTMLVSSFLSNKVVVFDLKSAEILFSYNDSRETVFSAKFTPDSKQLITCGNDNRLGKFNIESKSLTHIITQHKNWIRDFDFDKSKPAVNTCGYDGIVYSIRLDDVDKQTKMYDNSYWLTSVDSNEGYYVYGDITGKVVAKINSGVYLSKLGTPVNKIVSLNMPDRLLRLVVATQDKGVLFLYGNRMKYKSFM